MHPLRGCLASCFFYLVRSLGPAGIDYSLLVFFGCHVADGAPLAADVRIGSSGVTGEATFQSVGGSTPVTVQYVIRCFISAIPDSRLWEFMCLPWLKFIGEIGCNCICNYNYDVAQVSCHRRAQHIFSVSEGILRSEPVFLPSLSRGRLLQVETVWKRLRWGNRKLSKVLDRELSPTKLFPAWTCVPASMYQERFNNMIEVLFSATRRSAAALRDSSTA